MVRRKYHRLFCSWPCPKKTGPKGPSEALIRTILELNSRNPRFGSPRIARIISHSFGVDIDKNVVHRVLAKHYRPTSGGTGPSWLSLIGHTTDSLWSVDLFRCESIVGGDLLGARGPGPVHASPRRPRRASGSRHEHRRVPHVSTPPFKATVHRGISARIMIHSSRRTVGGRTFGFSRSTKSKPCRMCRCHTRSWSA